MCDLQFKNLYIIRCTSICNNNWHLFICMKKHRMPAMYIDNVYYARYIFWYDKITFIYSKYIFLDNLRAFIHLVYFSSLPAEFLYRNKKNSLLLPYRVPIHINYHIMKL